MPNRFSTDAGAGRRIGWFVAAVCFMAVGLTGLVLAAQQERPTNDAQAATSAAAPQPGRPMDKRLREGTLLVDRYGHFQQAADRYVFVTGDTGDRFTVLENLGLERVAKTLGPRSQATSWSVSGTVTEYEGANFLLIRRATIHRDASAQ